MVHLLTVDQVLQEGNSYRLSWHNPERTLMLMEIFSAWTWEEAFASVPKLNQLIEAEEHPVYTAYYYHSSDVSFFPTGASSLANLRKIMELDPPNEMLVFFVRQDSLTRQFMNIVTKTYGFRQVLKKYRFVRSFDEVLAQMHEHASSYVP